MPKWIHDRAEHLLAKNPSMPKSMAFAIATQQSHAVGKSPKGYGTSEGRSDAKDKYTTPKDDRKAANPGKLESPKMEKKGADTDQGEEYTRSKEERGDSAAKKFFGGMAGAIGTGALASKALPYMQKKTREQMEQSPELFDALKKHHTDIPITESADVPGSLFFGDDRISKFQASQMGLGDEAIRAGKGGVFISTTQKSPAILAHELGHAQIHGNRLGRLVQNPVTTILGGTAGAVGGVAGLATGLATDDPTYQRAAVLAPLALSAPTLLYEAGASLLGLRKLRRAGASGKQIIESAKQLAPAWGTYAARAGLGTLGAIQAQGLGEAIRNMRAPETVPAKEKEAASLEQQIREALGEHVVSPIEHAKQVVTQKVAPIKDKLLDEAQKISEHPLPGRYAASRVVEVLPEAIRDKLAERFTKVALSPSSAKILGGAGLGMLSGAAMGGAGERGAGSAIAGGLAGAATGAALGYAGPRMLAARKAGLGFKDTASALGQDVMAHGRSAVKSVTSPKPVSPASQQAYRQASESAAQRAAASAEGAPTPTMIEEHLRQEGLLNQRLRELRGEPVRIPLSRAERRRLAEAATEKAQAPTPTIASGVSARTPTIAAGSRPAASEMVTKAASSNIELATWLAIARQELEEEKHAGIGVGAPMTTSQYSGPLSYGPFKLVSGIPPFRSPSMQDPNEAPKTQGWMVGATQKMGAAQNTATQAMTPAGKLQQTQRVGAPKLTGIAGPSIADVSKPHGFGMKLPGATKNRI